MAESTNYQCPNCGGVLSFVGVTGKLHCEFCDSNFMPEEVERIYAERQARSDARAAKEEGSQEREQVKRDHVSAAQASTSAATRVHARKSTATDPVQAYLENSRWDDKDTEHMRAYNCSSCGAQLMVDEVTAVTSCPYCGNNAVLPGQLSDVLRPDYIIPFKLGKDDAVAALKKYYGGKRFLPNTFKDSNHIEEIQGVYVPFWFYSGKANGDITFSGERVTTWSDSDYNYTQTDYYSLHRAGSMQFTRVPVDGSTRMPDTHMDAIEPFDYSELVDFNVAYLPGYVTDRYDLDVRECDSRARSRVDSTCESQIRATVSGYTAVGIKSKDVDVKWSDISYALLPVWMLHTRWEDKDYLFAMNGQTGKLIGDLPIDNTKVGLRLLTLFLVTCIPIVLIILFVFGGYTA